MNVLKATEIWLDYHNAHSKKKIRFVPMNRFCLNFVKSLVIEVWTNYTLMTYYPF